MEWIGFFLYQETWINILDEYIFEKKIIKWDTQSKKFNCDIKRRFLLCELWKREWIIFRPYKDVQKGILFMKKLNFVKLCVFCIYFFYVIFFYSLRNVAEFHNESGVKLCVTCLCHINRNVKTMLILFVGKGISKLIFVQMR